MKKRIAILALIPLFGMALLPEQVPHFSAAGEADAYDPKASIILLFTLLALVCTAVPLLISRLFMGPGISDARMMAERLLRNYSLAFAVWFTLLWVLLIFSYRSGSFSAIGGWLISSVLLIPIIPVAIHLIGREIRNNR